MSRAEKRLYQTEKEQSGIKGLKAKHSGLKQRNLERGEATNEIGTPLTRCVMERHQAAMK